MDLPAYFVNVNLIFKNINKNTFLEEEHRYKLEN